MQGIKGTTDEFIGHCVECGVPLPGVRPHRFRSNPDRKCAACFSTSRKRRYMHSQGYVVITLGHNQRELEHRIVMAKKLGRPLQLGEVVHHINEVRTDNRPENLKLYKSAGAHVWLEHHISQHPITAKFVRKKK